MPYPLPLTRTEAYLAYKAGVIQQSDLNPSLAVPRNGIDAWLAYWTGLAADYPKREDGTPHILQEEEAYIAYLCGVINEYPEKCLRRVGAYLRYIISARWGRPDHPLNREELYLSLIKTQFIPSGDPSSDIKIDGTAKAAFVDIKMYGDTFQQSYTGKNLLSLRGIASPIGITGTVKDGSIVTVTGTVGSSASSNRIADLVAPLSAGTYTLTIDRPCDHVINLTVGDAIFRLSAGETSKTATLTADTASGGLFWGVTTNTTYNETFKLQLVAGSTPDYDYEPYVGGIASPNPDYPQPVRTVTGLQTVEVHGKNLIGLGQTIVTHGLTVSLDTGKGNITISGTATGTYPHLSDKSGLDIPSGTYTFSIKNAVAYPVSVRLYRDDGTYPTGIGSFIPAGSTSCTFSTDFDCHRVELLLGGVSSGTVVPQTTISEIMLEPGSTASSFIPYSKQAYDINLGKNLLEFGFAGDSIDNITTSYDGSEITLNGKKTGQGNIHNTSNTATVLPAGTYTVSSRRLSGSADNDRIRLIVRFGNMAFTTRTNISSSASSYAFTLDSAQPVSFQIWSDGTCICDNLKIGFMIEAGSQATAYVQFFEPIELCKLGAYQDYIWKDGGDWKVHKATGKSLFENMSFYASRIGSASHWRMQSTDLTNIIVRTGSTAITLAKTNVYVARSQSATSSLTMGFDVNASGAVQIYDPDYDTNSAESFIADMTSKGAYIVYPLATPTDTTITDQALIDQLEALVKGGSEEGTTYIKLSNPEPNLPGLLYVEAAKYV